jgi:hypothetical protein
MQRILAITMLLGFSCEAAAYLDPGTGSMILQGIIAGIAVAGITIRQYWYQIRAFFGKKGPGSLLDDPEEEQSENIEK